MLKYENREIDEKMKIKSIKKIMALTISTMTVIGMVSGGASAQWKQNNNGWWNSKGNDYSVGWEKVGNDWFYFDQDGYMKTGWIQDGNKWYFLNPNGDMAHDTTIDSYKLSSDGMWINTTCTTSTTGAAVVVQIDDAINTTSTTSAAVIIASDNKANANANNANGYLHKSINEKERIEKFVDKYNEKIDKQAQKIEKKLNKKVK